MSERTCAFSWNSLVRFLLTSFVAVVLNGFVEDVEAQEENTQPGVSAEVDPAGTRDLVTASRTGDLKAILDCVREFSINEPDSNHGVTPLSWAAAMGHADAVDLLLREGADINARNRDGATALHAASFFGHPEAAERLISQGADVNAETHDGARPLDVIKADWEVTREIAELLDIDLDEESVAAGRAKASELLRQRGAEQGGNTLFVLSIVFGCIVGGLAIVGVIIWLVYHFEKKRTEAMKAVAAEIGLNFSVTKDEPLLAKLQSFSLFNKGHGRKMKNVMKAETEIAQLTIFDYQYTTGGGKHSHTHRHTVVALESGSLRIPEFTLRPEGFFDKIGSTLGFQDMDFEGHPEFSRMFVLKGKNEEAIRHFFDAEMLSMFTQRKGATANFPCYFAQRSYRAVIWSSQAGNLHRCRHLHHLVAGQIASGWTTFGEFRNPAKRSGVLDDMTPLHLTRISNCKRAMQPIARPGSDDCRAETARNERSRHQCLIFAVKTSFHGFVIRRVRNGRQSPEATRIGSFDGRGRFARAFRP